MRNSLNILKAIESYILYGWIVWHLSYISFKLLKNKGKWMKTTHKNSLWKIYIKKKKEEREGGKKEKRGERITTHASLYWVWVEQAGEWEGRPHNVNSCLVLETKVFYYIIKTDKNILKQTHKKISFFFFNEQWWYWVTKQ